MGAAIISDFLTEILIPVAAVVGIVFALVQWVLVSKVKLSSERQGAQPQGGKNGYGDYLIEEEEGLYDHNVVVKCAEIQNAISEEAERRLGARRRRRPRGGVVTATGRQGDGKMGLQGEGDGAAWGSLGAGLEKPRAV